ncbi:MAG: hypothetical protein V7459_15230 [Oceanicoccus sp.]
MTSLRKTNSLALNLVAMSQRFFFNRRSGIDRRTGRDPRLNPRLDLSHKRRRKTDERRNRGRTDADDFYASDSYAHQQDLSRTPDKH